MKRAKSATNDRRAKNHTLHAERHAKYHSATRQAHAVEQAEDYVEAIAALIDERGEARVVELARRLGVSHVSVTKTIARLQQSSLVTARPYRAIFLTEQGRALASKMKRRHEIVISFLCAIGVDEEVARVDAEGIEHHVSDATLKAFEKFVRQR